MSTALAQQQNDRLSLALRDEQVVHTIGAALNGLVDPEAFTAQMLVALSDPDFADCDTRSKVEVTCLCATLGLLPVNDQVALFVRNIKGRGPCVSAVVQWQGFKAVMERHPDILEVSAHLVHPTDEFGMVDGVIKHAYDPFNAERRFNKIGDVRGGYLVVRYRDARRPLKYHFVTADYIDKCRQCAETQVVWNKWFEAMARKTIYRSAYSQRVVPIDSIGGQQLAKAIELDDEAYGNNPLREGQVQVLTVQPATKTKQIEDQLTAKRGKAKEEKPPEPPPVSEPAPQTSEPVAEQPAEQLQPVTPEQLLQNVAHEIRLCKGQVGQLEGLLMDLDTVKELYQPLADAGVLGDAKVAVKQAIAKAKGV